MRSIDVDLARFTALYKYVPMHIDCFEYPAALLRGAPPQFDFGELCDTADFT
jgi:hypothetical protein